MPSTATIRCESVQAEWTESGFSDLSDSVDIWRVTLTENPKKLQLLKSFLDDAELSRMNRYQREIDRISFVNRRGILRWLCSQYLGIAASKIEFGESRNRKPVLTDQPFAFNVSGSGSMALIAFASSPIGVDIEHINPRFDYEEVAGYCFTATEQKLLYLSESSRDDFYTLWTRKEAIVKQSGKGIDEEFRQLDATDGRRPRNEQHTDNTADIDVISFNAHEDYLGSIAISSGLRPRFINLETSMLL